MPATPGARNPDYAEVERLIYKGVEYRRYPNAKRRNNRVYFVATGGAHLHRVIYEETHGSIPEGWHVHHKDENPLNNDPGNLIALPPGEHMSHHMANMPDEFWERLNEHLDRVRPMTVAWHRSEEGRAWHREHSKEIAKNRVPEDWTCIQCGIVFKAYRSKLLPKFCSGSCSSKHRRDSGVDDEDRICIVCGSTYRCNKYAKHVVCSTKCSGRRAQWVRRGVLKPHPGDKPRPDQNSDAI